MRITIKRVRNSPYDATLSGESDAYLLTVLTLLFGGGQLKHCRGDRCDVKKIILA